MHHLLLITLNRPADATSLDTRERVYSKLINDDSFCGEGGRFGAPLCDWFVIGGRWSGYLKETMLGKPYQAAFKRAFPGIAAHGLPQNAIEAESEILNRFWHGVGGTGSHPALRSGYDELGDDDDAMIVDRPLYDHFLRESEGDCQGDGSRSQFADLDDEPVAQSFIGRKWLVVIDFHN
jgi:hypothetical protein